MERFGRNNQSKLNAVSKTKCQNLSFGKNIVGEFMKLNKAFYEIIYN